MYRSLAARCSRLRDDHSGATLLETALVLPFVIFIGFGAIEFGYFLYSQQMIASGVRDAARYAAGRPYDCDCTDAITSMAMFGNVTFDVTQKRVWWWDNQAQVIVTYHATDNSSNAYRGGANIYTVEVASDVPYQSLGFMGLIGVNIGNITVSHEERVIGVR